jgi:hypothetical protein
MEDCCRETDRLQTGRNVYNMSHSARPAFDVFPSSNFSTRRMNDKST